MPSYEELITAAKQMGRTEHIKVHATLDPPVENLHGESMWALADRETAELYRNDQGGMRRKVTLDNTSVFFPDLTAGTEVEVEMRSDGLPEIVRGPVE
jgi:hypothetical protein